MHLLSFEQLITYSDQLSITHCAHIHINRKLPTNFLRDLIWKKKKKKTVLKFGQVRKSQRYSFTLLEYTLQVQILIQPELTLRG